jgi:hypothetical protein
MNGGEQGAICDVAEPTNQPAVVYERERDQTTTRAVVEALSIALDVPETELPPIYDAVDPDALDDIFRSDDALATPDGGGHVIFEYEARRVRVESDGRILVY